MKIYLILSSLLTVAVAQQPFLRCVYFLYIDTTYGCDLTINNPNGLNNFTEIEGTHLEGFENSNVFIVHRSVGFSTNVPSIICNTFPNIVRINLYNTGITEIDDSAFSGCSLITELYLNENRITSISANAFVNLPNTLSLNLESNSLTTLPEDVFANQQNLTELDMNFNLFENIPAGLFRQLVNLQSLYLASANLNSINNQWFITNRRLNYLYLAGKRIAVSADIFIGLDTLRVLNLGENEITEIPVGAFSQLSGLKFLYLYGNNITELRPDSFQDLERLSFLGIRENPIVEIQNDVFLGLDGLTTLEISYCRIRRLWSNSFRGLNNLVSLTLNFNEIDELPEDVFLPLPNATYIGLWNNRLKTLRRNIFGALTTLRTLDLDGDIVNALDRAIIDDAVNLNALFFDGNLCASNYFGNFLISRAQYLPMLETCFSNMRYIVDIITEGDNEFIFFEGVDPGIVFRVNTGNEVRIALTPYNFLWNPVIEILIGTTNNTRSIIRVKKETDVVTVPNVIIRDQWNDFRIIWPNHNILVYRGNDSFTFMSFTMQDFFPVNFYGLRAVETRASWSVQPFQ